MLHARPSLGQAANSAAAAEALFSQARSLLAAGKFAEACPKFAESQRLDPATGTLMNLADCYEKADLLASAWSTWIQAATSARSAGQADREGFAKKAAAALEPRLARLTLQVQADPPSGLVIRRNGIELAQATWGTPLPVDRGNYRIEAVAPGHRTAVVEVNVENGQAHSLVVPRLVQLSPEEPTAAPVPEKNDEPAEAKTPAKTAIPVAPPPTSHAEQPGTAQRALGIVGLSLGGAGLAAGGVLGFLAISKFNDSKAECDAGDINSCTGEGVKRRDQALMFGDASTIAFGVGGALAAGGLILLLTAPRSRPPVAVVPTLSGLYVHYGAEF